MGDKQTTPTKQIPHAKTTNTIPKGLKKKMQTTQLHPIFFQGRL